MPDNDLQLSFCRDTERQMQEKGRCDDHDSMACVQDVRLDRLLSVLYGNVERYEEKVKFHKLPLLSSSA